MSQFRTYFITWTTYGTWMPGDARGWRKRNLGNQLPRPKLEGWSRKRLKGKPILLKADDRETVERTCAEHCQHRGWKLYAVNARSNHVHALVGANSSPRVVRDQLKANCTRGLRGQDVPLIADRTWTRGGDCEILDSVDDVESAVIYTNDAQDQVSVSKDRTR